MWPQKPPSSDYSCSYQCTVFSHACCACCEAPGCAPHQFCCQGICSMTLLSVWRRIRMVADEAGAAQACIGTNIGQRSWMASGCRSSTGRVPLIAKPPAFCTTATRGPTVFTGRKHRASGSRWVHQATGTHVRAVAHLGDVCHGIALHTHKVALLTCAVRHRECASRHVSSCTAQQ